MSKYLLCSAALAALLTAPSADAADLTPPSSPRPYNWSGFYAGAVAGAAWGQYDPRTATVDDGYLDAANAAAVTAAGAQSIKTNGFVTGIEGGYNFQTGRWLLGLEADLEAVHVIGQTNSGGVPYPGAAPPGGTPGDVFTIFSSANSDWLLTARPRIGFVAANNWLFYATGGVAVTRLHTDISFDDDNPGVFAEEAGKIDATKVGYAVGGGVEAPLTDRLSVKADYLHVGFGNTAGPSTANNLLPTFPGQVFTHSSDLKADMVRVGLNYHFGDPGSPMGDASLLPVKALPLKTQPPSFSDWQVEVGARLWFSSGREQEGLLFSPPPTMFISNLNYIGMDGISGETFARVDHSSGFFVKGNLGAGEFNQGQLNDEDFPAFNAYSNTLSSLSGHVGYATIDAGYNFLRTPNAKLGAFVGYNYYQQGINAYGCAQLAGDIGCAPPVQPGLIGITEYDHFHSLRLGLSSQVMLSDQLRLTADAAYLPWVNYRGLDSHTAGLELFPDAGDVGNGMMLEAALDYYVTANWTVGVGGRYWAWNMSNNGTSEFIDLTGVLPSNVEPSGFTAARYGVFVQSSYHWGAPAPTASATVMPTKASVSASGAMDWSGFYVGVHLGGGWSDDRWSDPFPSTPGLKGSINVAGFGDVTRATGPLGGGQIGANWQTGSWVLGVQADASAADIIGQNSCFTGLGGILCGRTINALGTLTGRVGYAWDRSLAYVKGGGAWLHTAYSVFGNTDALSLGSGSTTLDNWGWTIGAGVEYAITNQWTTFAEFDHIGAPSTTVPFPAVAVINVNSIAVKQSADLFKLGMNYKFDFGL
jgi:opacity protein-like surface antigen